METSLLAVSTDFSACSPTGAPARAQDVNRAL